jgi:hypothetical protein
MIMAGIFAHLGERHAQESAISASAAASFEWPRPVNRQASFLSRIAPASEAAPSSFAASYGSRHGQLSINRDGFSAKSRDWLHFSLKYDQKLGRIWHGHSELPAASN